MNVFEHLQSQCDTIDKRLQEIVTHYPDWPRDRIFEDTKRELKAINKHFQQQTLLFTRADKNGRVSSLKTATDKAQESIKSEIDNLVMIHVDEPGFEQGLEDIAEDFNCYRQFSEGTLYPELEKILDKDTIDSVEKQIENENLTS